jgi:two-component system, chemotaxis family, CheB/CheR fusion protein
MDAPGPSRNQDLLSLQASIIHAAREHLLVLDTQLRVKSATKSFYTAFQVAPGQTVGKELADLGNGQWNIPALLTRLIELPGVDGEFDDFKIEHDFPALGRRTMLVRARWLSADDAQSGNILLSFRDTTGQTPIQGEVGELLTRLRPASATPSSSPIRKAASHS